ncbi:desmoglein-2-like protein [Trichomycterus rosablanca]|uniref:desmoglein-2-like protein n=1 Tax=Trichomycterus rosablanca TaxID=2290929 RepID=UPI002F3530DE
MATWMILCFLYTVCCTDIIQAEADGREQQTLQRQKREWIYPPRKLKENKDYTQELFIAKIRSDHETRNNIIYSLIGHGANQEPVNLFTVDRTTGLVKINGILDREKIPFYYLKGRAKLSDGTIVEKDIELNVKVEDENDCPPVFYSQPTGYVEELSPKGHYVINITATDDDEPNTAHTQISYKIVKQIPAGTQMFHINDNTGRIYVTMNTLDREVQDRYTLIITGTDMNGRSGPTIQANTGTGTVYINIVDVNDNVPVLEKESYEAKVTENRANVEILRIKTTDADLIHTENWEAVYTIVSGNEAGYFNITTNPETNEGILMVVKELDYEQQKIANLKVVVSNKAKYHSSVVVKEAKSYPIKVNVVNVPEGPRFQPSVKVVSISEDKSTINLRKVVATYTAIDSDTGLTATGVRYVKGQDFDNWLSIDEKTAEIRLNKYPDRESTFLVNGTYYAKILCITNDFPAKTATGTIAIQVEDHNDHCPVLTSPSQTICDGDNVVYVTAKDVDHYPNAEPFTFKVLSNNTKQKWDVEQINGTTVILRNPNVPWPGHYTVGLVVEDQQGKSCAQNLQVVVCTCTKERLCNPQRLVNKGSVFGGIGILAMLLGLLLLLLIPLLLLFCMCGGAAGVGAFKAFPFDHKQQLITYHTEGQGEDKSLGALQFAEHKDLLGSGKWDSAWESREDVIKKSGWETQEYQKKENHGFGGMYGGEYVHGEHGGTLIGGHSEFWNQNDGLALSEAFLGSYYSKKVAYMKQQQAEDDLLLQYEYEGRNSPSGTLENICDDMQEEENSLAFLDDLGPQFKTLAKLCSGSSFDHEVKSTSELSQTVSSGYREGVKAEGVAKSSASISASASGSASTTQITTADYGQTSSGASSSGSHMQTLLLQQPTVYLSSAPVYMVEPQPQPTLLLATGPMLGLQESNVILLENAGTNMAITDQNTLRRLGLQHGQTNLQVVQGGSASLQGISGVSQAQGGISSSVRIVKSDRVQNVEPVQVVHSSSHSSISKGQSMQTGEQRGGFPTLGDASGISGTLTLMQHDVPQITVPPDGTHQMVREEIISVVEKSFQSTSAT